MKKKKSTHQTKLISSKVKNNEASQYQIKLFSEIVKYLKSQNSRESIDFIYNGFIDWVISHPEMKEKTLASGEIFVSGKEFFIIDETNEKLFSNNEKKIKESFFSIVTDEAFKSKFRNDFLSLTERHSMLNPGAKGSRIFYSIGIINSELKKDLLFDFENREGDFFKNFHLLLGGSFSEKELLLTSPISILTN